MRKASRRNRTGARCPRRARVIPTVPPAHRKADREKGTLRRVSQRSERRAPR